MSAEAALRQFEDNLRNYADTPEKHNLYNGLGNLALELQAIRSELQQLQRTVTQLSR